MLSVFFQVLQLVLFKPVQIVFSEAAILHGAKRGLLATLGLPKWPRYDQAAALKSVGNHDRQYI